MQFSLITITLNAEKFLFETLQSTLSQEFKEFEHLVWDGGSKDKTLEIAKSFPHIKIIEGKDSGIADAMNQCAAHAKGEFLLFLHADDVLAHSKVLLHLNTFILQRPQASWIYGISAEMDEQGKETSFSSYQPFSAKRLSKYNCISHPSTIIRKNLFMSHLGYFTHLKYCMDYDLWLRLSKTTEAIAFPGKVGVFRKHLGSLSTKEQWGVAHEAYVVRNA